MAASCVARIQPMANAEGGIAEDVPVAVAEMIVKNRLGKIIK
jgi:hypothetical protein